MVVYGQNGAGKSSFVDAVEYIIKDGKLAHLSHEYSGQNQEKGVINTHTPEQCSTELSIRFEPDRELRVNISRNGTHSISGDQTIDMPTWDYRQTVLRQDEVSRFIHDRKGEKYSALLPLFGLHGMETAAENFRQLARTIEQQSRLAFGRGELSQAESTKTAVFGAASDEEIVQRVVELHETHCSESQTKNLLMRCSELQAALNQRTEAFSAEKLEHLALRGIATSDVGGAIRRLREVSNELAESVEPLIAQKLEVLESTDSFALALAQEETVECPACGRLIRADELRVHVRDEQKRLQNVIAIFANRKEAIVGVIDLLKLLRSALAQAAVEGWRSFLSQGVLEPNLRWLSTFDPDTLRHGASEPTLLVIEQNCEPIVSAAAQASEYDPPDIKELLEAKAIVEAATVVFKAKRIAGELQRIEELIRFVSSVEAGIREEIRSQSKKVIGEISGDIGRMWKTLHPGQPIEDVRIYLPDDNKAIDIALKFYGKDQASPRLTLSEGYRNSLGLCIFLAMAKRAEQSDRPLFLDDVVVSFDRDHRGMIVQILQDEFANRQVVVFTHDRDWYAELRQQLDAKQWSFASLLPYQTPLEGIRWAHKGATFGDARAQINNRPDSAANDARKTMDVELAISAEKLRLRLPYFRSERNDKRTAHEFLERLQADGKTCLQRRNGDEYAVYSEGLARFQTADRLLISWANRGSHTFDMAKAEATKLVDACESALNVFTCGNCEKPLWFANAENAELVQCQCGDIRWRYGKA
jgi:energy-coupling factor transporter ATP-binding protein EcfA2